MYYWGERWWDRKMVGSNILGEVSNKVLDLGPGKGENRV